MSTSTNKNVVWFNEVGRKDVGLVGGKNANLGELVNADIPVPPGFAVTVNAFKTFLRETGTGERVYAILPKAQQASSPAELEDISRRVRDIIDSAQTPNSVASDITEAYGKLCEMTHGGLVDVAVRSSATAEDLQGASFAGQQDTFLNVSGAADVLDKVKRCWSSLFTPRAIFYRAEKKFDHEKVFISVGVQCLVDARSSGTIFTLNPSTGDRTKIVIEAVWGLGEGVVSGAFTPDMFTVDKQTFKILSKHSSEKPLEIVRDGMRSGTVTKKVEAERAASQSITDEEAVHLARLAMRIEKHYGCPQDIEFAIDKTKAFPSSILILQARPETVWAMQQKPGEEKTSQAVEAVAKGFAASPGVHAGPARIVLTTTEAHQAIKPGDILVTKMTSPDWVPYMKIAGAIVTEEGGVTSHAAIVSRELGVPCIVGARNCLTTLRNGTVYTVDGKSGIVYKGDATPKETPTAHPATPVLTASPVTATNIYVNISIPEIAAKVAAETNADGVGLLRAEHMMLSVGKHPRLLIEEGGADMMVEKFAEGIRQVAEPFAPKPVVYRFLDFKPDEFLDLPGGDKYEKQAGHVGPNPMIGYRGCYRYVKEPDIFRLECRAIRKVRDELGLKNVWVMVPFVRTVRELRTAKKLMEDEGLVRSKDLKLWIMVEVPSTALQIDEMIAEGIDGISFGTNDLTMLILGIDRNDAFVQEIYDERDPAVMKAMGIVIDACRKNSVTASVCGQAPSNYPELVEFLVRRGATSISVNPDKVVETKRLVATIEQRMILDLSRKSQVTQ